MAGVEYIEEVCGVGREKAESESSALVAARYL